MTKKTFFLVHERARKEASDEIWRSPHGQMVTISEPTKSREQEEKYHAMIGDISKTVKFADMKLSTDDWKRLLLDAFARVKAGLGEPLRGHGRVMPSLIGDGVVQLGIQSRNLKKKEASDFIEYLYSYGVEKDVNWSDKALSSIKPENPGQVWPLNEGESVADGPG